jgi:nicotinamide riboside kinase
MEENLKQFPTSIIKIAIYGPESTGKTTLARQLAAHFNTQWVPEFAREYLQKKFDDAGAICAPEDIIPIAVGQTALENAALAQADTFLFSDTCLMVTKVYSDMYYGSVDPALEKAARKHKYDLFFLTDVDVPWEPDDLRDRPDGREEAFELFKKALVDHEKPFITLSGDAQTRFDTAVSAVKNLASAKKLGFHSQDFVQIYDYGLSIHTIEHQMELFKSGIAKMQLDRPATIGDGILKLSNDDFDRLAESFDKAKHDLKVQKFVPASGAASRMFKFLSEFVNEFDPENETINAYVNRKGALNLNVFLAGMEKFPFFDAVINKLRTMHPEYPTWERGERNYHFIRLMLDREHFNFCNKPKGVLPFHKYVAHVATAVEEHLNEAVHYAGNGMTHLHFTVSEEHRRQFETIIASIKPNIELITGNTISVGFSYQDKSTDTIGVDLQNEPFRDDRGKLVFRPAGHGALIENLNRLDADIVFIKNIDNVIQNHVVEIARYKKALAGLLLSLQSEVFGCLNRLFAHNKTDRDIDHATAFISEKLHIEIAEDFPKFTMENKILYLSAILDRPIRVCGMVKNEGEPGGGPFWVRDVKGNLSLQIVETVQVDMGSESQSRILKSATHFNPVDLACGIRNYKGEKFDLLKFVDRKSGFIVEKNKNGRPLKAYELPGLWNGAMAKWITVFVEVPLVTFNPVKTVNDLLKPAHQPL